MEIFKNRQFLKLFAASFTSQMGTVVGNFAIAFYLLDQFSNQPYLTTLAELMYSLPTLFVFLFIGVVADRMDRQKVALYSDWIRAIITIFIIVAVMMGSLVLVFLLLFIRSGISKFFMPAQMGMLQGVVAREQYQTAAGLNQIIYSMFMLFGVGLGAFTYRTIGIEGALLIDGISFIISGLCIKACKVPLETRQPNGKNRWRDINFRSSWKDFKLGVAYVLKSRLLGTILLGFLIFGFVNGAFAILPLFTMKFKLAPDNYEWYASLFAIFIGAGMLAGSIFGATMNQKIKPYVVVTFGLLIAACFTATLGYVGNVWLYLCFMFVMGMVLAPINIALAGWLPELVEPKFFGRIEGLIDPLLMLAQSIMLGSIAVTYPNLIKEVDFIYYIVAGLLFVVGLFFMNTLPALAKKHANQEKAQSNAVL
ncbi:MFS transporter [Longirhabdus pacifica]|uniref:MFS transporter n=1 Tax=Longirhabdus pacifica TaxID=2305227 RepID=UPI0010088126|nr:MFS transporter [Longirhabdus pacifica]